MESAAIHTNEDGYPIVPAYRLIGEGPAVTSVVFWCRYCSRWHYHGAGNGEPGDGNGHRVAHCISPASAYVSAQKSGYVLEDVGTITPREMKKYARDAKKQRAHSHA